MLTTSRCAGSLVEDYLGGRDTLKMVVLLVDGRLEAQEMDVALLEGLRAFGLPTCVVATKIDKLSKHAKKTLAALRRAFDLPADQPLGFSSKTGEVRMFVGPHRAGMWGGNEASRNPISVLIGSRVAEEQGFKARSVFKLSEIQRRFRLFKHGQRVVDLGCFPGRGPICAATDRQGRRAGGGGLPGPCCLGAVPRAVRVRRDRRRTARGAGSQADVVLSDMAPKTTAWRSPTTCARWSWHVGPSR